jgi:ABC-type phosphate transport system auxiliary subunit
MNQQPLKDQSFQMINYQLERLHLSLRHVHRDDAIDDRQLGRLQQQDPRQERDKPTTQWSQRPNA